MLRKFLNYGKYLAIALLTTQSVSAASFKESCNDFNLMNAKQRITLKEAYAYGLEYGYEWILPAQAWKESSAGMNLYLKDIRGGSHGIYQSLLDNVLWREYELRLKPRYDKEGNQTVFQAPQALIDDTIAMLRGSHAFAAKHAILELQFWKPRTNSEWSMLASYNGGHKGSKMKANGKPMIPAAQVYAGKIQHYKKLMQTCSNSPLYGYR